MSISLIQVQLDDDAVRIYQKASQTDKKKLNLLLSSGCASTTRQKCQLPI
jgi:hypothetical protein